MSSSSSKSDSRAAAKAALAAAKPLTAPPNPLAKQLQNMQPKPFLYMMGLLFVPLGITILILVFILHSALFAAGADMLRCWWHYLVYHLWDKRGTMHSRFSSNQILTDFWIPVLLAFVTTRFLIMHTISRKLAHTSQKKMKVVVGFGLAYALGIWLFFRDIAAIVNVQYEKEQGELKDGEELGITPSRLFLRMYHSTFLFTLLSFVSTVWVPTSDVKLRAAESRVLKVHGQPEKRHYAAHHSYLVLEGAKDMKDAGSGRKDENEGAQEVQKSTSPAPSPNGDSKSGELTPMVWLHGYGAGKAFFFANVGPISAKLPNRKIYSLDLMGMGMSEHQKTMDRCTTSGDAENYFCDALEGWRKELGLEKMILTGHSFGGYISSCYALRYPHRVEHLILASPVGLPEMPALSSSAPSRAPAWAQKYGIIHLMRWLWTKNITLSQALHVFGPIGPFLFGWIIRRRFAHLSQFGHEVNLDALANYLYHLNAGACPGHRGLNLLLKPGAFAIDPLLPRLSKLQTGVSLLYGSTDWMDANSGHSLATTITDSGTGFAECLIIDNAGHQLYIEQPASFNDAIVHIVKESDKRAAKQSQASIKLPLTTERIEAPSHLQQRKSAKQASK